MSELDGGLGLLVRIDATVPLGELTVAIDEACRQVEGHGGKAAVVLDLGVPADGDWPGTVTVSDVNRWERAVRRLERLTALNIATARGECAGPALDLLLAADVRIATPDALIRLPINDGHFWPGMVLYRLAQHLGVARARQLALWGNTVAPEEAVRLGLVDQISVDRDEAVQNAAMLMGRISGRELTVRRQLLLEAVPAEYDDALGVHLAACDRELRRLYPAGPVPVPVEADAGKTA